MSMDALDEDEEHNAWPAFVDLLAATSLLFVTLLGVFIFLGTARARGLETTRQYLFAKLRDASDGGRLYGLDTTDHQFVRIILRERATFPREKYQWSELRPEGKLALTQIAAVLNDTSLSARYREVRILGYTDQDRFPGDAFSNWELSASRAAVVARYLVDRSHLDPCKVTATGRGPYYPIKGESKEASRRIEIQVVPVLKNGEFTGGCDPRGDGSRLLAQDKEP